MRGWETHGPSGVFPNPSQLKSHMTKKYYVVWQGRKPGIYDTWAECEAQVKGAAGARFKSFKTRMEAERAFDDPMERSAVMPSHPNAASHSMDKSRPAASSVRKAMQGLQNPPSDRTDTVLPLPLEVTADAWAVDAACSGNPGPMEYRGVDLATGATVFHFGPVHGTNNIGEFLAIVHALALLKHEGIRKTIYTDSRNALLWLKARKCRTKLARTARTEQLFQLIERAERWLHANDYSDIPIRKWETHLWGEVPADFGRK